MWKRLEDDGELLSRLFEDFLSPGLGSVLISKLKGNELLLDEWKRLYKPNSLASRELRRDYYFLEWFASNSSNISELEIQKMLDLIDNKGIIDKIIVDEYGRLKTLTGISKTTSIITLEKTVSGEFKTFSYTILYRKTHSNMPPVSSNGMAPDFSGNLDWLYPVTGNQKNIVKVKLTGKRDGSGGDFDLANQKAQIQDLIPPGKWKPDDYTWHHLDDFNPITGEATLQLVKTLNHESTLPHTGSVKQWENFTGKNYK